MAFLAIAVIAPVGIMSCAALAGIDSPTARSSDGGSSDAASNDVDAAVPEAALPRSCADIHAAGVTVDGSYAIDPDGLGGNPPFVVYCYRMTTIEPEEFLSLPANADAGLPGSNVSGFVWNAPAGDCPVPPTETVAFFRVRLNIQTMQVDTTDTTFAYIARVEGDGGELLQYGYAGSCVAGGDHSGRGNVDLTGTPFRMTAGANFVPQGYEPGGTSTFSPDRKRVDLTGGGFGGFNTVLPDAGGIGLEFDPADQ